MPHWNTPVESTLVSYQELVAVVCSWSSWSRGV